ncbi:RrF2 family transcriptional regulator [Clostridium pasteurianum]|nr:Rrf2 family transcriptional regulator [Clostridium pasteurianum]
MAYSLAMYQAISIIILIASKMEECKCRCEFLTTRVISENLEIAAPTAVKILNNLNAAGITITKEGAKGGILLAKSPAEITLLDIFLILERDRPLFKTGLNFNIHGQEVEVLKSRVDGCLVDAEKAMKNSLEKITIEDIMNNK